MAWRCGIFSWSWELAMMITLGRARLGLICAFVFATGTLAFELPVSTLFHQRGELANLSNQLSTVTGRNAELSSEVKDLHQNATIAAIAHADYGLVRPGQQSFVVLPAANPDPGSANSLTQQPVPAADLVPVDPSLLGSGASSEIGSTGTKKPKGSIVSRAMSHLEFWRWAF
jgi:cell division protein FtsB